MTFNYSNKYLKYVVILAIVKLLLIFLIPPYISDVNLYFKYYTYLSNNKMPYVNFYYEYPILSLIPLYIAKAFSFLISDLQSFRHVFSTMMWVVDIGIILFIYRKRPIEALYYSLAGLALFLIIYDRLDLLFSFSLLVFVYTATESQKYKWANWALVASVGLKLISIVLVPFYGVYLYWNLKSSKKYLVHLIVLLSLVLIVPIILFGKGYLAHLSHHSGRGLQIESFWNTVLILYNYLEHGFTTLKVETRWGAQTAFGVGYNQLQNFSNFLMSGMLSVAFIRFLQKEQSKERLRKYSIFIIFYLASMTKVFSTQFLLWILPVGFLYVGDKFKNRNLLLVISIIAGFSFYNYWEIPNLNMPYVWINLLKIILITIVLLSIANIHPGNFRSELFRGVDWLFLRLKSYYPYLFIGSFYVSLVAYRMETRISVLDYVIFCTLSLVQIHLYLNLFKNQIKQKGFLFVSVVVMSMLLMVCALYLYEFKSQLGISALSYLFQNFNSAIALIFDNYRNQLFIGFIAVCCLYVFAVRSIKPLESSKTGLLFSSLFLLFNMFALKTFILPVESHLAKTIALYALGGNSERLEIMRPTVNLTENRAKDYNVLIIRLEEVSGSKVNESGTLSNFLEKNKFLRFKNNYANSNATDVAVPLLYTGLDGTEGKRIFENQPLLWDYLNEQDYYTFLIKPYDLDWGNVGKSISHNGREISVNSVYHAGKDDSKKVYDDSVSDEVILDSFKKQVVAAKGQRFFGAISFYISHNKGEHIKNLQSLEEKCQQLSLEKYDCSMALIKDSVSEVIRFLRENNLFQKTLVIVTSDHGSNYQHDVGRINSFYEDVLRVPLFVKLPAGFELKSSPNLGKLTSNKDILPTILDVLSLEIKNEYRKQIKGVSIFEKEDSSPVFILHKNYLRFWAPFGFSIVTRKDGSDYKYINFDGEESIFNVTKDKKEANNLINDSNLYNKFINIILNNKFLEGQYNENKPK